MSEYLAMLDALQLAGEAAKVIARHRGSLALNLLEEQTVDRFLADFLGAEE